MIKTCEKKFNFLVAFCAIFFLLSFCNSVSADSQGDRKTFSIDSSFDISNRSQISAILEKVSSKAYFYVEESWFNNLSQEDKDIVEDNLESLGFDFDNRIYPVLTSRYGSEWNPGIDNDKKITVLFHEVKKGMGGYFNSKDEYSKFQNHFSNEREMVYIDVESLKKEIVKSSLAHEFTHLITFNQKQRLRGVIEDVWLNESRAEYASTLLGYDNNYQGSNLQSRVRFFINNPYDSLTEWQAMEKDYGVINLFTQYLIDYYGVDIFEESMKSSNTGIVSLNEVLKKNGYSKNLSEIFVDWTIAVFVNDCNNSNKYCYKNSNLNNLKVASSLIFLPSTQKTEFNLSYTTTEWAGNWYRIVGGNGDLTVTFKGDNNIDFNVPYVLCSNEGSCSVKFLDINKSEGKLVIDNFGEEYSSLTLIPSLENKTSEFGLKESNYSFSIIASSKTKEITSTSSNETTATSTTNKIPDEILSETQVKNLTSRTAIEEAIKTTISTLISLIQQLIIELQSQLEQLSKETI